MPRLGTDLQSSPDVHNFNHSHHRYGKQAVKTLYNSILKTQKLLEGVKLPRLPPADEQTARGLASTGEQGVACLGTGCVVSRLPA